ncbi:hypothetical protein J6590_071031 [Homalodisca vitripennis]|nr:hypothetical protein J6590_071031 [Homalodisca vitripennis]
MGGARIAQGNAGRVVWFIYPSPKTPAESYGSYTHHPRCPKGRSRQDSCDNQWLLSPCSSPLSPIPGTSTLCSIVDNPHHELKMIQRTCNFNGSVNLPTRVTATLSTTIDNVIHDVAVLLIAFAISDHDAQVTTVIRRQPNPTYPSISLGRVAHPSEVETLNRC